MTYRLDANDAFHDDAYYNDREEARTTPGPETPPRRTRAWAIEFGDYNPADHIEGTY